MERLPDPPAEDSRDSLAPMITPELAEGYRSFVEWRQAMARAGQPLPPGGMFILNRVTVLADSISILWAEIVAMLGCDPTAVKVDPQQAEDGTIHPKVGVDLPDSWKAGFAEAMKGRCDPDQLDQIADQYVVGVVERAYARFKANLADRLVGLDGRPDLQPENVIDALGQEAQTIQPSEVGPDQGSEAPPDRV